MLSHLVSFLAGAVLSAGVLVILLKHVLSGSRDGYEADYD